MADIKRTSYPSNREESFDFKSGRNFLCLGPLTSSKKALKFALADIKEVKRNIFEL